MMKLEDEAQPLVAEPRPPGLGQAVHGFAADRQGAGRLAQQQADDRQQGRLARPRRPQKGDQLAPVQIQVDAFQHPGLFLPVAEDLFDPPRLQHARHC
ncbi:hypothetical protein D3C87_1613990 [compost metagenome]